MQLCATSSAKEGSRCSWKRPAAGPGPRRGGPSPQLDRRGRPGSRAADHLAIDRDHPSHRPFLRLRLDRGRRSGLQIRADRRVQCVTVHALQQAAHGCGVRHRPQAGKRIGSEAEDTQHMLRGIRDPLADRDERASPGQHRRDGCAQQRDGRIPQSSHIAGICNQDQETPQVSDIAWGEGISRGAQLLQCGRDGR